MTACSGKGARLIEAKNLVGSFAAAGNKLGFQRGITVGVVNQPAGDPTSRRVLRAITTICVTVIAEDAIQIPETIVRLDALAGRVRVTHGDVFEICLV